MSKVENLDTNEFRDHLSNVNKKGKRIWVYAKKPKGYLYNLRSIFGYFLIGLLFAGPFITINKHPLLLLNVLERKFILFGMVFWPQDLNLFAILMLTFLLFIILFTVTFGRVWCGWACPQTLFMEMIFRRIEYLVEGDYTKQKKLKEGPWTTEKMVKKTIKQVLFFLVSFFIANIFVAYLIGKDQLFLYISEGPLAHKGTLAALLIFTTVFYFVYSKLRELVCVIICPYGRLQGLMLDKNSVVVAYDHVRGEPRSKTNKTTDGQLHGDCIDCRLCVHVCPTGIDIRNGTQLECINCTACIDACNEVMEKTHKPKGLIRFDSLNGITKGEKFSFGNRRIAYSAVLLFLASLFVYLLATRQDVETTVLRAQGLLYQDQGTKISNLYNIEFVNKTFEDIQVEIQLVDLKGEIQLVQNQAISVKSEDIAKTSFFILLDKSQIHMHSMPLKLRVLGNGKEIDVVKTNFMGPVYTSKN